MKGALALRQPVGTPIANVNSSTNILTLYAVSMGILTSGASAIQIYNSSSKAITISDGAIAVHLISFDAIPTSGSFALSYTFNGYGASSLFDETATNTTIQTALRTLLHTTTLVVTGSYVGGSFSIYYNGISGAVAAPTVVTNTLLIVATPVVVTPSATLAGVAKTFSYSIPPARGETIPHPIKNGSKIFAQATTASATTGNLIINFFG